MADVLKLFEQYLKKICGDLVDIEINYDKLPLFIEGSERNVLFWKIVSEFAEKLQMLIKENYQMVHDSQPQEEQRNNECAASDLEKKLTNVHEDSEDRGVGQLGMDPSLVQITASKDEMDRRIAAFLKKKQLDVDIQNQREFCNLMNTENEFSCARVDAVFLPRVGQISHITVTDANRENEIMKSDDITVDTILHSVPFKKQKTESTGLLPRAIEERLENIESHLKSNVKSVQPDVYNRLQQLEEKILYLEGLSPEYFRYKTNSYATSCSRRFPTDRQPQRWSSESVDENDLDERMVQLREKLLSDKISLQQRKVS